MPTALDAWLQDYGGLAFPLPKIAGSYAGKGLVIVGDAACVWDDLAAFGCDNRAGIGSVAKDGFDFLTVNKAIECFPGNVEHCYSNEPTLLARFIAARRNEYTGEFKGPVHIHTGSLQHGVEGYTITRWPWGGWGTSALGACFVGLMLGYDRLVLAGVPLENGPHNGEPPWRSTGFLSEAASTVDGGMNKHWKRMRDFADGRVRSLSGRTRRWLGPPE